MFRRLAAVAACAALLAAVPTGALYVTTLPSGADVWLDGAYVGHSPLVLDALVAGRHTVSLTKAGWTSQDLDVAIVAGSTALSSVQLQRARGRLRGGSGWIALKGQAVKEVAVDGTVLKPDKTGLVATSSGSHEVVVRTSSGKMTRTVTVYPDMRTDVILRDDETTRSAVVAPASDYLPDGALRNDGARIVIRHGGHEVIARIGSSAYRLDGRATEFDAAPTIIGGKLYLPLELLMQLTANDPK